LDGKRTTAVPGQREEDKTAMRFRRTTERGTTFRAHVVNYAHYFVILSRNRAANALVWVRAVLLIRFPSDGLVELRLPEEDLSAVSLEQMYSIFRSYLTHEDDLINQRTTWFTTLQNFTLVTFGLVYAKIFDTATGTVEHNYHLSNFYSHVKDFLLLLAFFGFVVSLLQFLAVAAAQRSISALEERWRKYCCCKPIGLLLPPITGGGDIPATTWGHRLPRFLPWFCMLAWAGAMVYIGFLLPALPEGIAGNWWRVNDGLAMRVNARGDRIDSDFIVSKTVHVLHGQFFESGNYSIEITRGPDSNGCKAHLFGSFRLVSPNEFKEDITAASGDCQGFPRNFTEHTIWHRV
jgi:hypothetical protein